MIPLSRRTLGELRARRPARYAASTPSSESKRRRGPRARVLVRERVADSVVADRNVVVSGYRVAGWFPVRERVADNVLADRNPVTVWLAA